MPRIEVGVDAGKEDSGAEEDDDTCEEWERHEALHDDVHANRTIGRQVKSFFTIVKIICGFLNVNEKL